MKVKHDKLDDQRVQELDALKKRIQKTNNFMRLSRMSEPKFNIFFGIVVSVL